MSPTRPRSRRRATGWRPLGPIDVWVNVAFVGSLAFFWDTNPDEFRRMTEVTYFGQVFGVRAALR